MKVGAGRAQWEVQGLPRGQTFRVGAPSAILGVRGTRFAVEASPDAERVLVFEGTVERGSASVTAGSMLDVRDEGALPVRLVPSQTRAYDSPPVKMPPQDAVFVPGGSYRLKGRPPPPGVVLGAHLDDWTRASDIEVSLGDFLLDRRPASSVELRAFERSRAADKSVPPAVAVETVTVDAAQADGLIAWQGKDLPTEAQYEVAVRGASGKWPTPRTDVEYSWGGDLRYQDPAYAHPSDVSPWGVPGLLKHERLWMRGPYTSGPFFRAGAVERAAFDSWKAANGALRLQRGRYPGLYPSVYPGTARSPKYADPQIRVPADPVGIGFVRGVIDLAAP